MAAGTKVNRKAKPKGSPKRKKVNVFHERLGSLTYYQACQLLGDDGSKLIRGGGQAFEVQSDRDVYLGGDLFRVRVEDAELDDGLAVATITLVSGRKKQLQANCNQCQLPCEHLGAAFEFLLTAKSELGLAMPPDGSVPLENLTTKELHARALAERQKRGKEESMIVRSADNDRPWTDYVVTSKQSGRSYRVALRSMEDGDSFCTCPDFRINHLSTCKHIINVQKKVKQRFSNKQRQKAYRRKRISVAVDYGTNRGIRFHLPHKSDPVIEEICGDIVGTTITDARDVLSRIEALEQAGRRVQIYPDAESYVQRQLVRDRVAEHCREIRKDPANHPLRTELLDATLLPYQLDGIAFSAGAGRAILADDMGLGKTIQGIGVAELLSKFADIQKVLIVCPASLKSQWRSEIAKFSGRSSQLILGNGVQRAEQYQGDSFFTICNYEQVLRDITAMENVPWDLIILDEGQRIKNWESKTSQMIRMLESPFRLVLSGTPLENRLGELYTVTKFVDDELLGPAYQFFNRHHVVDDRGKTQAYHRLDELRDKMSGVLLRRTRKEISNQLPERTDEIVRIEATQEQFDIQNANVRACGTDCGQEIYDRDGPFGADELPDQCANGMRQHLFAGPGCSRVLQQVGSVDGVAGRFD